MDEKDEAQSVVLTLKQLVADLPEEAEAEAFAALAALSEPSAADAAIIEHAVLERLENSSPHLVHFRDVAQDQRVVDGILTIWDCPDCTRGTRSIDGVLVCMQLPDRVAKSIRGQSSDVIACGRER